MAEIGVEVENDYIDRPASAKLIVAFSELIWNAFDGDGPEARIDFQEGGLTKPALVRIEALEKADPV